MVRYLAEAKHFSYVRHTSGPPLLPGTIPCAWMGGGVQCGGEKRVGEHVRILLVFSLLWWPVQIFERWRIPDPHRNHSYIYRIHYIRSCYGFYRAYHTVVSSVAALRFTSKRTLQECTSWRFSGNRQPPFDSFRGGIPIGTNLFNKRYIDTSVYYIHIYFYKNKIK